MKTRNIFKAAAMMALVLFASCSKEEIKDSQDNGLITLTVPAIQGFGDENAQSRTVFEFSEGDVTPPKVKWVVGDIIYIGKTNLAYDGKTSLKSLVDRGEFIEFECKTVNDKNIATFQGESIPAGSDVAIYTKIPDKVTCTSKNETLADKTEVKRPGFQCNMNEIPVRDDNTHLAENDLLVSHFNTEDKALKFGRAFGLIKFELQLPNEAAGSIGTFSCANFRELGRIFLQSEGKFGTDGKSKTYFNVKNLTVGEDGKLIFYSLAPIRNISDLKEKVKYVFTTTDKTYSVEIEYGKEVKIETTKAIKISATLTEQPAQ